MTFSASRRQVRSLHLRAAHSDLVARGLTLVEDALRTASLPEAGSRMIVIRRLPLGRINPSASPSSVALTIESRLREIRLSAVHAASAEAKEARAIYFHDEVEPFVLLALTLARGQKADAWFWPLAVPEWNAAQPLGEALQIIVRCVVQTRAGIVAAAAIIDVLREADTLDRVLAALTPQDGTLLLRAFGWSKPELRLVYLHTERMPVLPVRWQVTLIRWVTTWGVDDARSAWLTGAALVAEQPARGLDVQRRIGAVLREVTTRRQSDERPAAADSCRNNAVIVQPPPAPPAAVDLPSPPARSTEAAGRPPRSEPGQDGVIDEPAADDRIFSIPENLWWWLGETRVSQFAGLYLLLPLMGRLGIQEGLEDHPEWIDLDLPLRIVREVARRVRVPARDPALLALPRPETLPAGIDLSFTVPARWLELAEAQSGWRIRRGDESRCALFDSSGVWPLAAWSGESLPDNVRALIHNAVEDSQPLQTPDLTLWLASWVVAMRRWLRRYADITLRELVTRTGQIAATRTHIDVLFDHTLVDMRIRAVGLDFDPGWLPWLGRVVAFHYVYPEDD